MSRGKRQAGGRVRVQWVGAGCASVQVSVATWQDSPPWMIFKFCSTSAAKWPVGLRKVNGLQRERHFFSPLFHPPLMTFNFCSTSLLKRPLLFPKFTGLQREHYFCSPSRVPEQLLLYVLAKTATLVSKVHWSAARTLRFVTSLGT